MLVLLIEMIYLDYAASAPIRKEVRTFMDKYSNFANPSSSHSLGKKVREDLEKARGTVTKIIGPGNVIFTSSGTESINLALKGIISAENKNKSRNHLITTKVEHKAVLETCKCLEENGFVITYLNVNKNGKISLSELEKAITNKTSIISIQYVNNETGIAQPIKEISKITKKHNVIFHTDACQAGYFHLDANKLNVDALTINSSKIGGPKGTGLLWLRKGLQIEPLIHGGGQEFGLRGGTENVVGILGFIKALELFDKEKKSEIKRLNDLKQFFATEIKKIPNTKLIGSSSPHIIAVSFSADAETLLNYLDQEGIYASTGSACTSNQIELSHVLTAVGLSDKDAASTIRFSFGKETTRKELEKVIKVLQKIIPILNKIKY